ncbi:excisionase family DNA-binding protein [Mycobacterium adipatum]|uniref:excisionase family DNA-binding protein n=1 Tax=Mycobacterium adipatum TaxID=1682113 RepID=UPI0034E0BDBB
MDGLTDQANARLNSVETVIKRLGIGRSKVYEELSSGHLRSVKVGRRRLVSEAAIVDYIAWLEDGGPDAA